jgi:FkbM family methyltransferase
MNVQTRYGFSLEVNPDSYVGNFLSVKGFYDEPESEFVRSVVRPGDRCIDAGAHVGYYSLLMASLGAQVLAIEPNRENFSLLSKNTAGKNVILSAMALSDTNSDGPVDFHIAPGYDDGCSSLASVWKHPNASTIAQVWTVRLDYLASDWSGRIRLLKMDIEHSEPLALIGLGSRLDDIEHILIECTTATTEAIHKFLERWPSRQIGDNFHFRNPGLT